MNIQSISIKKKKKLLLNSLIAFSFFLCLVFFIIRMNIDDIVVNGFIVEQGFGYSMAGVAFLLIGISLCFIKLCLRSSDYCLSEI